MTRCVGNLVTVLLHITSLKTYLIRFKDLFVARNIVVRYTGTNLISTGGFWSSVAYILKVIIEVARLLDSKSVTINLRKWSGRRMEKCFSYY